jgi:hypothetical protein
VDVVYLPCDGRNENHVGIIPAAEKSLPGVNEVPSMDFEACMETRVLVRPDGHAGY